MKGIEIIGQEDLSTVECEQEPDSRLQTPDENPLGARDIETQEAEGKKTPGSVNVQKATFSRSERLSRAADFDRVYFEGKRIASSALVLFFCPSGGQKTRLGLSVGKRIGKAVTRNRVKRRLRDVFRLNKHRFKERYDILLVARRGVQELKFREVEAAVLDLFRRGGLLAGRTDHLKTG